MCKILKRKVLFIAFFFAVAVSSAQTEFPKEFIAHIGLHTGAITGKSPAADIFVGSLDAKAQVTLIEHVLRCGITAGSFYAYKKINGLFGPTVSLKIAEFKGGYFGSVGNVHVNFDHLWGTNKQRLAGGGINVDLLNRLVISLTGHRDYKLNNWWLQSGIAFRITKVKQPEEKFPH